MRRLNCWRFETRNPVIHRCQGDFAVTVEYLRIELVVSWGIGINLLLCYGNEEEQNDSNTTNVFQFT